MNQSDVSQATVISKRSTRGKVFFNIFSIWIQIYFLIFLASIRPPSLLTRILKPSTPKPLGTGVKFINRCVRDIDRLSDTFGQEWITLPNFV
jgi:hypothetical protein